MAYFYGTMQGSRGEATRCGTKNSGITAHARGWSIGGRVSMDQTEADSGALSDAVTFTITSGSTGGVQDYSIGTFTRTDLDRLIEGSLKLKLIDTVCARCGLGFVALSGNSVGCPAHGIVASVSK